MLHPDCVAEMSLMLAIVFDVQMLGCWLVLAQVLAANHSQDYMVENWMNNCCIKGNRRIPAVIGALLIVITILIAATPIPAPTMAAFLATLVIAAVTIAWTAAIRTTPTTLSSLLFP